MRDDIVLIDDGILDDLTWMVKDIEVDKREKKREEK